MESPVQPTSVAEKSVPIAVYEEFTAFIAQNGGTEAVIAFRPSEAPQDRAYELLYKERDAALTPGEASELNHYRELEHLFRMAKARARLLISSNRRDVIQQSENKNVYLCGPGTTCRTRPPGSV